MSQKDSKRSKRMGGVGERNGRKANGDCRDITVKIKAEKDWGCCSEECDHVGFLEECGRIWNFGLEKPLMLLSSVNGPF